MRSFLSVNSLSLNVKVFKGGHYSYSKSTFDWLQTPVQSSKIINPKPLKLGTWNLERTFTSPNLSCVMGNVSRVTWYLSQVTCHFNKIIVTYLFLDKELNLVVRGSVINGGLPRLYLYHLDIFILGPPHLPPDEQTIPAFTTALNWTASWQTVYALMVISKDVVELWKTWL